MIDQELPNVTSEAAIFMLWLLDEPKSSYMIFTAIDNKCDIGLLRSICAGHVKNENIFGDGH